MGRILYLALGLLTVSSALVAAAVDEEKPHGRVCVSIFEPGPPEKEEAFQISTSPGTGKIVRAYIDASEKCSVLFAAITKDGKLVNGWRPQLSEVPGDFEEILLPNAPVKWEWTTKTSSPFDFYVLFLAPGSKEIEEAKKLVDAMQNPKVDERVLALQTGKLKELIGRLAADKTANQGPASEPEIGGVFRGTAFPWRQYAKAANFSPDRPGVVIQSSEAAEKK